jgi:hypothetical protein
MVKCRVGNGSIPAQNKADSMMGQIRVRAGTIRGFGVICRPTRRQDGRLYLGDFTRNEAWAVRGRALDLWHFSTREDTDSR